MTVERLHQPALGIGLDAAAQRVPQLGPVIATNGFDSVAGLLTNLGASVLSVASNLQVTLAGAAGGSYVDVAVTPGQAHLVQVDARVVSAASASLTVYDGAALTTQLGNVATAAGTWQPLTFIVTPTTSTLRVYLGATGSALQVAAFDNLSVRAILG